MKQVIVGTSATLVDVAGNRDFLNLYNNDGNPVYLCYDGSLQYVYGTGVFATGGFLAGATVTGFTFNAPGVPSVIQVGQIVSGAGIPANVVVVSISASSIVVTTFTATANQQVVYWSTGTQLTTSNGWPLPSGGGELFMSNDGHRNVFNKDVWAVSSNGGADLRVQGAS